MGGGSGSGALGDEGYVCIPSWVIEEVGSMLANNAQWQTSLGSGGSSWPWGSGSDSWGSGSDSWGTWGSGSDSWGTWGSGSDFSGSSAFMKNQDDKAAKKPEEKKPKSPARVKDMLKKLAQQRQARQTKKHH